jgi:hypothetical protein
MDVSARLESPCSTTGLDRFFCSAIGLVWEGLGVGWKTRILREGEGMLSDGLVSLGGISGSFSAGRRA